MTLREMMTATIDGCAYFDSLYKHRRNRDRWNSDTYREWLNSLSDEDFFDTYNRVREAEFEVNYEDRQ